MLSRLQCLVVSQTFSTSKTVSDKRNETALWNWFSKAVEKRLSELSQRERLHWGRVENSVKAGYFDVEGCWNGVSLAIELKSLSEPYQIKSKLTGAQAMALYSRAMAGGRAFLLAQVKDRYYLVPGKDCVLVQSTGNILPYQLGPSTTAFYIFTRMVYRQLWV